MKNLIFLNKIQKKNINETCEEGINQVYNQYKTTISSRAASGDVNYLKNLSNRNNSKIIDAG